MHTTEVIVSAPGKAILHGEHAVVHGKVALAVSLNLRTYLRLHPNTSGRLCINLPNIDTFMSWDVSSLLPLLPDSTDLDNMKELDISIVQRLRDFNGFTDEEVLNTRCMAIISLLYIYLCIFADSGVPPSLTVTVCSELPTGAGLGSSAAFSVCLAASMLAHKGIIPTPLETAGCWSKQDLELINSWAFLGEKIIHGTPSGVDNAVGTMGGILKYHAGKITPLNRVPTLRILLTNTRVPRSTKLLVAGVRDKVKKFPSIMNPVLESIDAISHTCERTLEEMCDDATAEKYSVLEELVDINQHHLNVLGVGHPSLDNLCSVSLLQGLHSKLTGAGGGGCGITLLRPDTERLVVQRVTQELKDCGYDCWETSIGVQGVQHHSLSTLKNELVQVLTRY